MLTSRGFTVAPIHAIIRAMGIALTLLSLSAHAQGETAAPGVTEMGLSTNQEAGRLRWGLGGLAGPFLSSPVGLPLAGAEGRLGYQLGRTLAVYGAIGVATGLARWNNEDILALWASVGVLAELTFFDHFFVALGPALALGGWGAQLLSSDPKQGDLSVWGATPALDFRLGVALGGRDARTGQRTHFSLGLGLLVLFGTGTRASAGDGRPTLPTHAELAVAYAPTLMLGYDVR